MPTHKRFDDEPSDYEASDSDEDYNENARILLEKVRQKPSQQSDSEESVFGVGSDGSDEDKSDIALSDVEGNEDDDLPDVRAWGKDKRKFYSTDYIDPDYGGFEGKDAHLAELEEEEARNLQQQLAQQLDDDDFVLQVPTKDKQNDKSINEEIIKSDISKLSKRQKLQILQKESPEFFGLVEDFTNKMKIVTEALNPIINTYKKGQIPNCPAMDFITTHHELILNYCINIYMYLLLKSTRTSIENHPIIKRLYQYRQLLSQLEPVYDEIISPQVEMLLEENQKVIENEKATKKTLQLLKNISDKISSKTTTAAEISNERPNKKVKFNEDVQENSLNEDEVTQDKEEPENEISKRAITYQIAKNKGLTPYRKKEQRNPRVKHRNKFRKAKIRRKGAVREPRTEMSRYGGETSGIKASVAKSIKLKS